MKRLLCGAVLKVTSKFFLKKIEFHLFPYFLPINSPTERIHGNKLCMSVI